MKLPRMHFRNRPVLLELTKAELQFTVYICAPYYYILYNCQDQLEAELALISPNPLSYHHHCLCIVFLSIRLDYPRWGQD
jgi:hypothetical protein